MAWDKSWYYLLTRFVASDGEKIPKLLNADWSRQRAFLFIVPPRRENHFQTRLATAGKRKCRKKVLQQWCLVSRKLTMNLSKSFLRELSENKNKKKSAELLEDVLKKRATERNVNTNLEEYECEVLDQTLSQFYAELRKETSGDYEPDSLNVKSLLEKALT